MKLVLYIFIYMYQYIGISVSEQNKQLISIVSANDLNPTHIQEGGSKITIFGPCNGSGKDAK